MGSGTAANAVSAQAGALRAVGLNFVVRTGANSYDACDSCAGEFPGVNY